MGIGLALGLAMAAFASHLLASILYGVTRATSFPFGATVSVAQRRGFLATIVPAYRALRIDPAVVCGLIEYTMNISDSRFASC